MHAVQEADAALSIYESIADEASRKSFIAQFEACGSGKGAGSLKFAHSFGKALIHEDKSSVAANENLLTRPKILEFLGMTLRDFKTQEEALKVSVPFVLPACFPACLHPCLLAWR